MTSKSFLEQLYYGNISPVERSLNPKSKTCKIMKAVSDEIEKFNSKLSEDMQKELDRLLSLKTTESCQMELDGFIYGCRFIFRLLIACMGDENNDFKIEEILNFGG
ncbi:MAG: hypothetical protein IKD04_03415 [Clostridia bacterium]|nr:hypothetical protein [Clostridia bacterium]